jgi:Kef-type K+ transport system membrane component KefB
LSPGPEGRSGPAPGSIGPEFRFVGAPGSLVGIAAAFAGGFGVVVAFGHSTEGALLAGVALAASSVGIAARTFSDLGALRSRAATVVLGAAVVDDVAVLAFLPLVLGAEAGSSTVGVLFGLAAAVVFVVLVAGAGSRLARRPSERLAPSQSGRVPFVPALIQCLGLALLAEVIGLAALVGAFLASMVVAETDARDQIAERMEPLFELLVPFFFVVTAARVDLSALGDAGMAFVAAAVGTTLLAKLLGCGAGAMGLARRERLTVGAGMLPRGEVTLAVATAGLASGALDPAVFGVLLVAVLASNLMAPLALRPRLPPEGRRVRRPAIPPEAFDIDQSQADPAPAPRPRRARWGVRRPRL